jgi:ComF family protein
VGWIDAARRAERWVLTAECLSCHGPVGEADEPLVCAVCRMRWRAVPDPVCRTCGEPTDLGLACRLCAEWPGGFGPVRSAVRLDPAVRELVHAFKYDGWWRLADAFALRIAPLLPGSGDADLVPIPLTRPRRARRGYNQAECLAEAIGRITGLPVRPERVRRVRETGTQTRLAPDARLANLARAFVAAPGDRPAVLVDDVFTTGATLCSAAAALLDAGAASVGGVTFARAAPPLSESAASQGMVSIFRSSEDLG